MPNASESRERAVIPAPAVVPLRQRPFRDDRWQEVRSMYVGGGLLTLLVIIVLLVVLL